MSGQDVTLRAGIQPTIGDVPVWEGDGWGVRALGPRPHSSLYVHTQEKVHIEMGRWQSPDFESGVAGWRFAADGSLEANDIIARGTVYADDGEIGGWTIGAAALTGGDATLHSTGYLLLGTGTDLVRLDATDATYRMWVGAVAGADAPFSVTKAGAIKSTSGTIGGWAIGTTTLASANITLDDGNDKITVGGITLDGAAADIESSTYASGVSGFHIDEAFAEFGNAKIRGELTSAVFVKDLVQVRAGSELIVPSGGVLDSDMVVPGSGTWEAVVKDPPGGGFLFANGDICTVKSEYASGVAQVWFTVAGRVDNGDGTQSYTCTYQSGTKSITYPAGGPVLDYGVSEDGGLFLSADDTYAPFLSVFTHAGAPWTTTTEHVRIGNLNGLADYDSDEYGMFVGSYSGDAWMAYDPTNDLRIYGSVVVGPGLGFTLTDVLAGWHFDGPDNTADYQVDLVDVVHGYAPSTATGSIVGVPGKFSKGVSICGGFTNLEICPSFEYGTTGWTTSGSNTIAQSSDQAKFGSYSLKCTYQDSGNLAYDTITLTAAAHTLSACLWIPSDYDGGAPRLYFWDFAGGVGTNYVDADTDLRDQWQLLVVPNYTIDAGDLSGTLLLHTGVGATPTAGKFVYLDAVQCTVSAYPYPFRSGDMPGASWNGTVGSSTTLVIGADLEYSFELREQFSISLRFTPIMMPDEATYYARILQWSSDATNRVILEYDHVNDRIITALQAGGGTTVYNVWSSPSITRDTPIHLVFTRDGSTAKLYGDGQLRDSDSWGDTFDNTDGTLHVGNLDGAAQCNGTIDDLVIVYDVLSAADVETLYQGNKPFAVQSSPFSLLLTGPGQGKVWGHAGGLFGMDDEGSECFALVTEDGVTWGGFTMDAGDVVLGDNVSGSSAIRWDKSAGTFGFYGDGSGTVQVEVDTDGSVLAGAGEIRLNSESLAINLGEAGGSALISFEDFDAVYDCYTWIWGQVSSGYYTLYLRAEAADTDYTNAAVSIVARPNGGGTAYQRAKLHLDTASDVTLTAAQGEDVIIYTNPAAGTSGLPKTRWWNTGNIEHWLQDAAGSNKLVVFDSGNVEQFNVDSDGAVRIRGGVVVGSVSVDPDDGCVHFMERSSDPGEPAEGEAIIWRSDGTGKGDDGDVLIASKAGGTAKWTTLLDHSAGSAW